MHCAKKRISLASKALPDRQGEVRREMIAVKKSILLVFVVSWAILAAGCGSYGKLRLQQGPGETMTIQQLKENWDKYHILATGVEPNVPSAIIFDRRDDSREIIGERWWELRDGKTVAEITGWIEAQTPVGPYSPRLWKILGPDDYLYGYMFTAWDHAVMAVGDDKIMRVMDLPVPPFLAVNGAQQFMEFD